MRRLSRLFGSDGKTVVVAMDHGMGLPVNPALDKTGEVLEAVVKGGADAVLTTYGIATRYADVLKNVGLILRLDGGGSVLCDANESPKVLFTVEDALRVGADAVACMGFPGSPYEYECMANLAHFAAEGHKWGMPVLAEMLPGGFDPAVPNSVDNLVLAARTGCEYGADIIKTSYNGTPEEFKRVVDASFKPVIVLGGEAAKDVDGLLGCIEGALDAGAAGVAIGRNVWKQPHPEKMVEALVQMVHGGKKASEVDPL